MEIICTNHLLPASTAHTIQTLPLHIITAVACELIIMPLAQCQVAHENSLPKLHLLIITPSWESTRDKKVALCSPFISKACPGLIATVSEKKSLLCTWSITEPHVGIKEMDTEGEATPQNCSLPLGPEGGIDIKELPLQHCSRHLKTIRTRTVQIPAGSEVIQVRELEQHTNNLIATTIKRNKGTGKEEVATIENCAWPLSPDEYIDFPKLLPWRHSKHPQTAKIHKGQILVGTDTVQKTAREGEHNTSKLNTKSVKEMERGEEGTPQACTWPLDLEGNIDFTKLPPRRRLKAKRSKDTTKVNTAGFSAPPKCHQHHKKTSKQLLQGEGEGTPQACTWPLDLDGNIDFTKLPPRRRSKHSKDTTKVNKTGFSAPPKHHQHHKKMSKQRLQTRKQLNTLINLVLSLSTKQVQQFLTDILSSARVFDYVRGHDIMKISLRSTILSFEVSVVLDRNAETFLDDLNYMRLFGYRKAKALLVKWVVLRADVLGALLVDPGASYRGAGR
ncbi:hypothetical protein EV426DRAFT_619047 [Tirmania nivea]|nr:hypothetical protein EV426DRAFT_619047 [Tirmania nivea]